ncbi:transglutaminase family protein [Noviherbaspirillum saxi]|uniref:Transglutaminase family protein n=1 Tax=Noviherbaspirillum saxi TaxID=2320863 RepID=A0A3A3GAG8_9BURK|nr:transglutaminase family protein [Noviherbaspirillum saxi]RJF97869.1 transglutaminase family protein [Noviherbaspirillum saxi]
MPLSIRHETVYHYTAPLNYTIQQLRLTPRVEPHQRLLSWNISSTGRMHDFADAFGNRCHMLTICGRHDEVRIVASGTVDVAALDRGRLATPVDFSPLVFTVPTRLTEADAALTEFAHTRLRTGAGANSMLLLELADAIQDAVLYQTGATVVTSTAAEALRLKQGVCQDHAHLFLACCHVHGIPARYVSGYIDPGDSSHAESHAWVDVWVDEDGFSGWVSIDVTHARFTDASHCRLGIGRDYDSAAPIRGVRRGGGNESLSVRVEVLYQS